MAHEENFGTRDLTYSAWHRRMSTQRFVGIENAQRLHMIDLDAALYIEYDDETKEPLALVETARESNRYKCATVTRNLARKAGIPAFTLLYTPSNMPNPSYPSCMDIASFRVRRIWPEPNDWKTISPKDWAEWLLKIRQVSASKLDELLEAGLLEA